MGTPPPTPAGGLTAGLPRVLIEYAFFHFWVILFGLFVAIVPLRAISRYESGARGRRSFVLDTKQRRLPRVWSDFLLWKELFAEPLFRFNRSGMVAVATFVTLCLILGGFFLVTLVAVASVSGDFAERTNQGVRILGTFVMCLLLLGTAIRAAGSFGAERDRLTLESLLTTPADNGDIVWAKWLGSVLCGRKLFWYLGIIWLVGLIPGGLSPVGLFLLIVAFFAYAIFFAGLGLWFSLISRTTTRAYIWTLLTVALLCTSNLILWVCLGPLMPLFSPGGDASDWVELQEATMVPYKTLYHLALSSKDVEDLMVDKPLDHWDNNGWRGRGYHIDPSRGAILSASLLGLIGYALAGMILWGMTSLLFGPVTGRVTGSRSPPETPQSSRDSQRAAAVSGASA
jgi:ABC-type transport system involved in multi-copper enzyme maturation permease subunit